MKNISLASSEHMPSLERDKLKKKEEKRSLIKKLRSLSEDNLEQKIIHDCTDIKNALVENSSIFDDIFLISTWTNPVTGKVFLLRSVSFHLSRSGGRSLEYIEQEKIETFNTGKYELCNLLELNTEEYSFIENNNTKAFFRTNKDQSYQKIIEIMHLIFDTYNQMVLSSNNFSNFIGGQAYHHSKPSKKGDLHPKFNSYTEISDVIEHTFNVQSNHFIYIGERNNITKDVEKYRTSSNKNIKNIIPYFDHNSFFDKLKISLSLKQPIVGKIENQTHFCIFPIHDPAISKSAIEGFIVLDSCKPIDRFCFSSSETWIREYSVKRHLQKAEFLTVFRNKCNEELKYFSKIPNAGRRSRRNSISNISNYICKKICDLTLAESTTFRLLHHSTGLIKKYGEYETALSPYSKRYSRRSPEYDIHQKEWDKSLISFSLKDSVSKDLLYVPNVDFLPTEYIENGLKSVLSMRQNTRCELAIKIKRGNLLCAILNIESPIIDAFRHEQNFFSDCQNILSYFLTQLETVGDREGLTRIAEGQMEVHSIKDFVLKWDSGDVKGAVWITSRLKKQLTRNHPNDSTDNEPSVKKTKTTSVKIFNKHFRGYFSKWLKSICADEKVTAILSGSVNDDFPVTDLTSLFVIFDSLFNNIRSVRRNHVSISTTKTSSSNLRILVLTWSAPSKLSLDVDRDKLFLQPIFRNDNPHYGFFLAGVHSRSLGGHVEFSEESCKCGGFEIKVFIPYTPEMLKD